MFTIDGIQINAPGYTAKSFDRAVERAHNEGVRTMPCAKARTVITSSGTSNRTYFTTRETCTCRAGQQGRPCKHRALAIFLVDACRLDITREHSDPTWRPGDRQSA